MGTYPRGNVYVERYRGYDVVYNSLEGTYTIWAKGRYVDTCRAHDLRRCIDYVERTGYAWGSRTHEVAGVIAPGSVRVLPRKVTPRVTPRAAMKLVFAAWMVFAVCLFIAPLVL